MKNNIWQNVLALRSQSPLVHNLTNRVVMNFNANVLLAVGASPVMTESEEEAPQMAAIASSLVVNPGTLDETFLRAARSAGKKARELGKAVILDPVGCGATEYRTKAIQQLLLDIKPSIVRGNASEIVSLSKTFGEQSSLEGETKGVDSTIGSEAAISSARAIARELSCVVCVSGKVDRIVSNGLAIEVHNGVPLLQKVVGTGCAASALVAAFAAVESNRALAAASAMTLLGVAGELANERSRGPGSFASELLDALSQMNEETFLALAKVDTIALA